MRFFSWRGGYLVAVLLVGVALAAQAQNPLVIYTDGLANNFDDWSYTTRNFANIIPVHGGTKSISVSPAGAYEAISFHHADFNTSYYTNFSFWVHGGTSGGQLLQVYAELSGVGQPAYTLPVALTANTWQQFTIPLSTLGVADKPNCSRINIQVRPGPLGTFYVDDVQFGAKPVGVLNINATQAVRSVDSRWFGVNLAMWDNDFDTPQSVSLLNEMGTRIVRLPGGSLSDEYHWMSNTTLSNTWTWVNSFSKFIHVITNASVNAQAFVTVNYGTGTPQEAAAWVRHANVTNQLGFKYWEIGNECYGTWETDSNNLPHDAYTYALRATNYLARMRAADPTIKIGIPVVTGENTYVNGYTTNHPTINARTGTTNYGWTPVLLATLKSLGYTPDYLVHHVYPEYLTDNDQTLLQASANWASDAADLRQQITDYFGSGGTNIELICTENNADASNGGKQSTSLVNGLYYADSLGSLMKTEFNSFVWWDLRNSANTDPAQGDFSASLYGWRTYGDLGLVNGPTNRHPTFYAAKLMSYFARTNDTVLNATTTYSLLTPYAIRHASGAVSLLTLNKDPTTNYNGQILLNGFTPGSAATVLSYGIPQDEATRTNAVYPAQNIATNIFVGAGTNFTYNFPPLSLTLLNLVPSAPRLAMLAAPAGQFAFQLQGQANVRYVIQSSSNLAVFSWTSVSTNTLINSTLNVTNLVSAGTPQKYWRAVWLP